MPNRGSGDKTKAILADSLRTLLEKKPLDKIKIRDIVDECELNRQTFYYHFQDMYALVEWMYSYDVKQIIGRTFDGEDIEKISISFLIYIEEHREEIRAVLDSKASEYFTNFLNAGIRHCCNSVIDKYSEIYNFSRSYKNFLSTYYTSAIIGIVINWIKSSDSVRQSPDNLMKMFRDVTKGSLELALENSTMEA